MLRQYLKSGLRNILKNKGFSLINLTGLSLGLASLMALAILVYQNYSTDRFHEHRDRIYYLKTIHPDGYSYSQTTFPLLYEIQESCPEVEATTHWQGWDAPWFRHRDVEVQENTIYVDSGFFDVFSFSLKEGNPATALDDKYGVVISQKVASRFFGQEKALGKTITASDSIQLTVTGVLDKIPANSSLKAEVILPVQLLYDNQEFRGGADWYNTIAQNYLLLKEGADPKLLDKKIDKIVKQYYAPETRQNTVQTIPLSQLKTEGDPLIGSIITGAIASAVFIILVMLANLLNLNSAMVFSRTKEIAVRRVIGSGRQSIFLQFCIENSLIVVFSLLSGFLLFTWFLLPQVNGIMGDNFADLAFNWKEDYLIILLFLIVGALLTLVAGSVPVWYLTTIKVSEAVKGKFVKTDGKGRIRSFFIALQFTLAVVLIAVALILNGQIRFMKSTSPGFNTKEVVVVNLDLAFKDKEQAESRFQTILHKLQANPNVKSVATTRDIPTKYREDYNFYLDVETGKEVHFRHIASGADFTETYEIPIMEGRSFDDERSATEGQNVVLNETAVKAFGWTNPIGRQIKEKGGDEVHTVIGVMADFHYDDLKRPIEPLLHWYGGKKGCGYYNNYLSIRLDPKHQQEVLAELEQDFSGMNGRRPFTYHLIGELVDEQYAFVEGLLKVTNFVALLTVFISAIGLFGLVAFFARQRVKEIGIRKVLGASVQDITVLLSKDFLKLVLLAILIGSPISWYAMHIWLEDFAYRITISGWVLIVAGLFALIIASVTVSFQAIKAARANPVKNLRTE